jgi:Ca2+-binding EF-hand superfamily protein
MLKNQRKRNMLIYLFALAFIASSAVAGVGHAQMRPSFGPDGPQKGRVIGEQEHQQRFREADLNGDGKLSFEEFRAEHDQKGRMPTQHRFERTDTNGDGYLQREELQAMRAQLSERFGDKQPPEEPFDEKDLDGDGKLSLAEFNAGQLERRFQSADANSDGYIEFEEAQAVHHRMRERRHEGPTPQERFSETDLNGDGRLSFEEFKAGHDSHGPMRGSRMFEEADANGDGYVVMEEMQAMHAQRPGPRDDNRPCEERFSKADTDGDGKLSLEEFQTGPIQRMFDRLDANADGYIQLEEMEVMHARRHRRPESGGLGAEIESEISGDSPASLTATGLHPAYPNPFNPTTSLRISLQESADVTLCIYDITGRLVETLCDGSLSPGDYSFTFVGTGLASGLYFAELRTGETVSIQKLMLSK